MAWLQVLKSTTPPGTHAVSSPTDRAHASLYVDESVIRQVCATMMKLNPATTANETAKPSAITNARGSSEKAAKLPAMHKTPPPTIFLMRFITQDAIGVDPAAGAGDP
eukprot:CAMPEP_0113717806 /NCGR_PEP_ID=MMETSP0038_2-20120614/34788_1 /TAXON_ID=2898 /ORGANISM="Cryptomonas paramecium" /LENGTH=107 /DNA_ID=CAMNT_0000645757 /DNA_START=66 /DNA_END=389 /DNA_ORIENTATION=- /assembly_acc=CAM_ASM_000170